MAMDIVDILERHGSGESLYSACGGDVAEFLGVVDAEDLRRSVVNHRWALIKRLYVDDVDRLTVMGLVDFYDGEFDVLTQDGEVTFEIASDLDVVEEQ